MWRNYIFQILFLWIEDELIILENSRVDLRSVKQEDYGDWGIIFLDVSLKDVRFCCYDVIFNGNKVEII